MGVLATLGNGGFSSSGSQYNVSEEDFQSLPDFLPQPDLSRLVQIGAAELAIIAVIIGVLRFFWSYGHITDRTAFLTAGVDMIETGATHRWASPGRLAQRLTLIGIDLVPLIPTLFSRRGVDRRGTVPRLCSVWPSFDPSLAGGGAIAIVWPSSV